MKNCELWSVLRQYKTVDFGVSPLGLPENSGKDWCLRLVSGGWVLHARAAPTMALRRAAWAGL